MAEEPFPSPSPFSGKHHLSPDPSDPAASPKRRRRHRRRRRDVDDDVESPLAEADRPLVEDVEEGEILDDAMDVYAAAAAPDAAPELGGNRAHMNSDADATVLHASRLPSHSFSRDKRRSNHSAHESESGGVILSDADDTKGDRQSQRVSKSPQLTREKERKYKDEHHKAYPKDSHSKEQSRKSPSRHRSQGHARHHSRSRDTGAEANGLWASTREDSDRDSNDKNSKHGRHATRSRENGRERSSSHAVCDKVYDDRERYKHERKHISNPVVRDKVDLHELTRRDRERSSSRSRSDRRESAYHIRDESRESERRSSSSRHKDNERRNRSKDRCKESDKVDSGHEREKMRDDRDRGRHKDLESGKWRNGEGKDRDDKHKDSTRSRYITSDSCKHRSRSRERGRDAERRSQRYEELKENSFKEEDEEEYQEKIEQQLAMQEEEDPEKIKEEARRRKEAIMAKYRQQQLHKRKLESLPRSNDEEEVEMNKGDNADLKDDNDSRFAASEEAENKHDSSNAIVGETDFTVEKSPAHNDGAGTLGNQRTTGVSGLGEGTPKSERSADMFCDDIFGESPAGIRKLGKDDGLRIEKNVLHDNWDDAEGYYTYRFGELLDGRYEITAAHGKGVFSTVVRAKDLKSGKDDPEEAAIKIIRNNETMYKAGKQEVSILEKLASADHEDRRHCVRFISSFMYRNHLCLVFESLNMNLREVLKKFGRNIGLKLTAVRAYSKQLFIALKHLKNCKVLHCDIKPDNMLVNEAKNVLKLCDFGNAMLAGMNEVTPYLVSRFYRAPEIILGLPYDHPLDMWSVGCCLYELYTGKVLFPGPSNNDMLRLHMELKGPFPKKMLRKGAFTMQHFDQDLNFHATEEDPVTKKVVTRMILNIKPKDIGSLISNFPGEDPKMLSNFKDLLEKMFVLDPEKRITISQALSHPFITAMRSEYVGEARKYGRDGCLTDLGACSYHLDMFCCLNSARASAVCTFYMLKGQHKKCVMSSGARQLLRRHARRRRPAAASAAAAASKVGGFPRPAGPDIDQVGGFHAAVEHGRHRRHGRPQRRVLVKAAQRHPHHPRHLRHVRQPLQLLVNQRLIPPLLVHRQRQHRAVAAGALARRTLRLQVSPAVLPAAHDLQQHHAEAVHVGLVGDGRVGQPLRRRAHQLAQPKVGDLDAAAVVQRDVLLDVAVEDLAGAAGVQVGQPARRAHAHAHPRKRHWSSDPLFTLSAEPPQPDEVHVVRVADHRHLRQELTPPLRPQVGHPLHRHHAPVWVRELDTYPNPLDPSCDLNPSVASSSSAYVNLAGNPGIKTSSPSPSSSPCWPSLTYDACCDDSIGSLNKLRLPSCLFFFFFFLPNSTCRRFTHCEPITYTSKPMSTAATVGSAMPNTMVMKLSDEPFWPPRRREAGGNVLMKPTMASLLILSPRNREPIWLCSRKHDLEEFL